MSLRHAVLAALVHGEASGYELAKRFDAGVANFWHARPQQLYAELTRLHNEGLVKATEVVQVSRPTKRLFSLTDNGIAALVDFAAAPKQQTLRDELTVAVQAADVVDPLALIRNLEERATESARKLEYLKQVHASILGGRTEDEFARTTGHLGPYLTSGRGVRVEENTVEWCAWAIKLLRAKVDQG